ncbi:hypothetical protein HPP92_020820 [Vanilla planifolia]|uniref:Uncharacterized protein n=1 Tax=Vanilla planifolia TaxID=51239 RepID=A0A835Q3F0_VANPL|nr:hypothetical protein HPP92_020820 [Vanilla planifolia]
MRHGVGLPTVRQSGSEFLEMFIRLLSSPAARRDVAVQHVATIATTLYYIWSRRNALIHNGFVPTLCSVSRTVRFEVSTTLRRHLIHSSLSSGNPGKSSDLLVTHGWLPPLQDGLRSIVMPRLVTP